MVKEVIMVGIGGGAGSILRYLTTILMTRSGADKFPIATFTANLLGCFLIGLLLGLFQRHPGISTQVKLFFTTGFCGGYTTFSAFAAENIQLLQSGHSVMAWMYIAASILGGLLAVWLGISLVSS